MLTVPGEAAYKRCVRRPARVLACLLLAFALAGACTSGSTSVTGGTTVEPTGPTATGPTAATGATAPTGPTAGGPFDGPVSIANAPEAAAAGFDIAFFSCEGVLSEWRYIVQADLGGGFVFDVDTTVDLSDGSGRLVFGGEFQLEGLGTLTWQDSLRVEVAGTADAPTLVGSNLKVDISGSIPIPLETFEIFPEQREIPIEAGSDRC